MDRVVLVPLDGSPTAEHALAHAQLVARATGWRIRLLHVVADSAAPIPSDGIPHGDDVPAVDAACPLMEYLAQLARPLRARGFGGEIAVLRGDPATVIAAYAAAHPEIALVALTTHGRRGLRRWLDGSVAEKLLHAIAAPVLLIPADAPPPAADAWLRYDTIMVPLDGSLLASAALPLARTLALHSHALTILIQALVPALQARQLHVQHAAAMDELSQAAAPFEDAGLTIGIQVRIGEPAEAILAACRQSRASLIVMSTHGRHGCQRVWHGSVAGAVAHAAPCPVLLIQPEGHRAPAL